MEIKSIYDDIKYPEDNNVSLKENAVNTEFKPESRAETEARLLNEFESDIISGKALATIYVRCDDWLLTKAAVIVNRDEIFKPVKDVQELINKGKWVDKKYFDIYENKMKNIRKKYVVNEYKVEGLQHEHYNTRTPSLLKNIWHLLKNLLDPKDFAVIYRYLKS